MFFCSGRKTGFCSVESGRGGMGPFEISFTETGSHSHWRGNVQGESNFGTPISALYGVGNQNVVNMAMLSSQGHRWWYFSLEAGKRCKKHHWCEYVSGSAQLYKPYCKRVSIDCTSLSPPSVPPSLSSNSLILNAVVLPQTGSTSPRNFANAASSVNGCISSPKG